MAISDVTAVSVELLDFDLENPRFADASHLENKDDKSIIRFYLDEVDLRELLDSISSSGYIDFDPMLVLKANKRYTVVEGNRRLAALKLLRSAEMAQQLRVELDPLTSTKRATLNNISVRIMTKRADGRAYIGFKHINGPHKWEPLARAQYVSDWLDEGGTIEAVAKTLGDTNDFARRLVFGYRVLMQAEQNGYSRKRTTSGKYLFSHLYTALTRAGFRDYLGLTPIEKRGEIPQAPVKKARIPQLIEVMGWLFGDREENVAPVVRSQNPDVGRLNDILENPKAKSAFLARRSLDEAHNLTESRSQRFTQALLGAQTSTERALALVSDFDGSRDLLESVDTLVETATILKTAMEPRVSARKRR